MQLENSSFARLIAIHSDVAESEYLLKGDTYLIGRLSSLCDIVVNRKTVSRVHARIDRRGSHYVLHNLSRNPTIVNGKAIEDEHILEDWNTIGLATPEPVLRFLDFDPTVVVEESPLRYDEQTMTFYLRREPVALTPSQFRLLQHLYQNAGHLCTREACAIAIWGENYLPGMESDNLDKVMSELRSRLRLVDPNADLIESRWGQGYILVG